jgi:hypothetical protein
VLCFARFCESCGLRLAEVMPVDLFEWVAWQTEGSRPRSGTVVAMVRHSGAAPASVNRRVAAVRALFEYLVMCGDRSDNPVPAPRRGQGCGSSPAVCWGIWVRDGRGPVGGWSAVRAGCPSPWTATRSARSWPIC